MKRSGKYAAQLPQDVLQMAKLLVAGYDDRCRRWRTSGLDFDRRALEAVEQAAQEIGLQMGCVGKTQELLRKKLLLSVRDGIPYEHLGETFCGRSAFYAERTRFFERVARAMGMIGPQK